MADMDELFGSDGDSDNDQRESGSGSGSDSEQERPRSASNASGSGSDSERERDDDDEEEGAVGDDSEDEQHSQHSGSDNQSERSGNQSDASMHSDQGDHDHSDAEQHSGSERGHRDEDEDEDDEDGGHRSDGGSPAGSGIVHSDPGTPQSGPATPHSDGEASAGRTNPMMRSGEEGPRATNRRTRRKNAITLMKKERTLMTRGRGTGKSAKGSDSEDEFIRQKKAKATSDSDSDSDIGTKKVKKTAADDLFGEADDISSDSDAEKPLTPGQPLDTEDGMEGEQAEEEPAPETRIEVEIPKVSTDLGSDLYFVKLPNFLSVEPRPFDPQYYEDEFEDEEMLDEEGRTRLKLKVENTIRWRVKRDEEGNETGRVTHGSMSLHLGNEVFDVYKAPLQGDHNHLFIRQGTGLQGQAVFKTKLTFR
ncbi:hypothetical protein INR49_020493 [Caranx melampygus]|nr:hypothetical protein INR49_020493 [Caranx melampygus]